jgi:hypothetical protein
MIFFLYEDLELNKVSIEKKDVIESIMTREESLALLELTTLPKKSCHNFLQKILLFLLALIAK